MSWFLKAISQYADFSGRARRKEYWYFALFTFLISLVLVVIDALIGTLSLDLGLGLLSGLFSLALIIPSFAVTIRRLHDIGRSGWWCLIGFIPIIGGIIMLVFCCTDSEMGSNVYGPNPKSI